MPKFRITRTTVHEEEYIVETDYLTQDVLRDIVGLGELTECIVKYTMPQVISDRYDVEIL